MHFLLKLNLSPAFKWGQSEKNGCREARDTHIQNHRRVTVGKFDCVEFVARKANHQIVKRWMCRKQRERSVWIMRQKWCHCDAKSLILSIVRGSVRDTGRREKRKWEKEKIRSNKMDCNLYYTWKMATVTPVWFASCFHASILLLPVTNIYIFVYIYIHVRSKVVLPHVLHTLHNEYGCRQTEFIVRRATLHFEKMHQLREFHSHLVTTNDYYYPKASKCWKSKNHTEQCIHLNQKKPLLF